MNFKRRLIIYTALIIFLFSSYFIFLNFSIDHIENELMSKNGEFLECDNTNPISKLEDFIKSLPQDHPFCEKEKEILIGILSRTTEFGVRNEIRYSWGLLSAAQRITIKVLFIVGVNKNISIAQQVENEFEKYGDILLLNFTDHYKNLSMKTYGLLSYAHFYCPNIRCLLKVDSDMIVNVDGFQKLCHGLPKNQHIISGHVEQNVKVRRTLDDKFYIPYYVYANSIYPDYASGPAYLLSGYNITTKLLKTTQYKTRFLRSENFRRLPEDIIFTGEVRELANISIKHIDGIEYIRRFSYWCDASTNYMKIPLAYIDMENNRSKAWTNMREIVLYESSKEKSIFLSFFRPLRCFF